MDRAYYVYVLANKSRGTLYIGVTGNIARRLWEHQRGLVDGFTKKYRSDRLVYCEVFERLQAAIQREKQLKKWNRISIIRLIESSNPEWRDLCTRGTHMP